MTKDEALARMKGLLMVAADRSENGDENGSAAACLMISEIFAEGVVAASDIEAVFSASTSAGLEAEVDDFAAEMDGEEGEDEEVEEEASAGSALSSIAMMAAAARKGK